MEFLEQNRKQFLVVDYFRKKSSVTDNWQGPKYTSTD